MPTFNRAWTARCRGTTPYGKTCGRPAIIGGYVCPRHGGKDPEVRREALERYRVYAEEQLSAFELQLREWAENRAELGLRDRELSLRDCPVPGHAAFRLHADRRHAREALRPGQESRWCREGGAWHNVPKGIYGEPGTKTM